MFPSRSAGRALAALALVAAPAGAAASDCMDSDPVAWTTTPAQRSLYNRLAGMLQCPDDAESGPLADQVACNYFVGRALSDIHAIDDFRRAGGGWLLANEIADYVRDHPDRWTRLGAASSQAVLNTASQRAGEGRAVIAVKRGEPGHVALILPGTPRLSSGWGLRVPNSAAFSLGNVDGAYVFCRLSYAFSAPGGVDLYARAAQ